MPPPLASPFTRCNGERDKCVGNYWLGQTIGTVRRSRPEVAVGR
jgi:hypothetical protein